MLPSSFSHLISLLSLLLLAAAPLKPADAAEFDSKEVKRLTSATFDSFLASSEKATIATFYAPWCGHCKRLAPEYQKAAKNMNNLVNFVAVDCDDANNRAVCARYDVKGFPTIKTFGGKRKTRASDYMGERSAKAMADHAADIMPSNVKRLKSPSELEAVLDGEITKPTALLVTNALLVTPLYKALSTELPDLDFYVIRDKGEMESLKERLGTKKVPSVMMLQPNGDRPVLYQGGKMSYENLVKFFSSRGQGSASSKDEL